MAKQTIDLGTLGGADGTGDSIRAAGAKINSNFNELYGTSAVLSHINIVQNEISSTLSNADIDLKPSGMPDGFRSMSALDSVELISFCTILMCESTALVP